MKRVVFLLAVAGFVLGAWGCTKTSLPKSVSVEENGIEYYLETDRSSYRLGESVTILYRVTNKTDEVRDLGTVFNCEYCIRQLQITLDGREIWRTCRVPPPCGQKELRLNPHESWTYTEQWSMINDNGTLEPEDDFPIEDKGKYNVTGDLLGVKISLLIEIK